MRGMRRRQFLGGIAGAFGLTAGGQPVLSQVLAPQRRLAGLAIGINDYANLRSLVTAEPDALSVADRLAAIGYDMGRQRPEPGIDGILAAFSDFAGRLDRDTAAFVFMAGHGLQVEGRNYFLPADMPALSDPDALSLALPVDALLETVAKASPAQTIVVLDACRDDALGKTLDGYGRGFASTVAPRGCFIAYSAGFGEFALDQLGDGDTSSNGLFTRNLLRQLAPERTIYDIITATRAQVIPQAEAVGHRQHPAIYDQSQRTYWLDGVVRFGQQSEQIPVGTMNGTGVIIAARDEYACSGGRLTSPKTDAARLQRTLSALGANVNVVLNASRQDVLAACTGMSGLDGVTQLVFVWLGRGLLHDMQAAGLIEQADCSVRIEAKTGKSPTAIVTHSDLVKAFRPNPLSASDLPVPLTLLFDIGLAPAADAQDFGDYAADLRINDLPADFLLPKQFQDVALLTSCGFNQQPQAGHDQLASSPFVTALVNALGRPGLAIRELARLVQGEVETMTQRAQSPRLFASQQAEGRPLVNALLDEGEQREKAKAADGGRQG